MMMMKNVVLGSALTVTLLLDGAYCISPQKLSGDQLRTLQYSGVVDVKADSDPSIVSVSMLVDTPTNPMPNTPRQGNYVLIDPDASPLTPSNAVSDVQYDRFRNMTLLMIDCPYTGDQVARCDEFQGEWFDLQLPNDMAGTHFFVNGPVVVANEAVLEINLNDPSPAPGQQLSDALLSQFPRALPISQDAQTSFAISVGFQRPETLPGGANWVWARWEAPQLVNCEDGQIPGQQGCQILAPTELLPSDVDATLNLFGYYESENACQANADFCWRACVYLSEDKSEKGPYKADYYFGSFDNVLKDTKTAWTFGFDVQTTNEALRQFNFQHGSDALGAYGNATVMDFDPYFRTARPVWPIERNHVNNTIRGMYMDLFMTDPFFKRHETQDCPVCGKLAGVCTTN